MKIFCPGYLSADVERINESEECGTVIILMSALLFCRKLAGCTLFITGGSRGIGKAIALKAARDGANVVIAAKTAVPHPKLPGTIYTAAQEGGPAEVTLQT